MPAASKLVSHFLLAGALLAAAAHSPAAAPAPAPAVGFSTLLGGIASEDLPRIDLDGAGNVYVVGTTSSLDFPTLDPDGAPTRLVGGVDVFVAKLVAAGDRLEYATYVGGSGDDRAAGVAVDADGNVWVTGSTDSLDFPVHGPAQPEAGGNGDGFLVKLDASGRIAYASYLGGSGLDSATGVALGADGAVHVTGNTGSADFPLVDPLQAELGAPSDAFVATFDATGSRLSFATFLGGAADHDAGFAIAAGPGGAIYVTGSTASPDFPQVGGLQPELGGGGDAFVAKLDPGAPALLYSTRLGGGQADAGLAIAVDAAGSAYVTGQTRSTDFPTRNGVQNAPGGGGDAFVVKLSADGTAVDYSTFIGGSGPEVGGGIAVDGSGNAYVTGMSGSEDFPGKDSLQPFLGGGSDAFVSRLNDSGSSFAYSTLFGGAGGEAGIDIAVDGTGNAYVVGQTGSPDFPVYNPIQAALAGPQDVFVSKLCLALIFPGTATFGSGAGPGSVAVTTPADCAWLAHANAEWIRLTSPNAVAGSGEVSFELAPNPTGHVRSGTITIGGATFTVAQEPAQACDFEISPSSENFYMIGGVGRVNVRTRDDCGWTATSNETWIHITSVERASGSGSVTYRVDSNNTGRQRAGTITIAGFSFVVFDWIRNDEP